VAREVQLAPAGASQHTRCEVVSAQPRQDPLRGPARYPGARGVDGERRQALSPAGSHRGHGHLHAGMTLRINRRERPAGTREGTRDTADLGTQRRRTPSRPLTPHSSLVTVSSGTFAQVAGAILGKQAWVENPDKDEFRAVRRRRGLFGAGWDQRASVTIPRSSRWWDRLVRSLRVARSACRRSPRP
jgi:hypothetical protein